MSVTIPVGAGLAAFHFACAGKADDVITTCGYTPGDGSDPSATANTIYNAFTGATAPFQAAWINTGYSFLGVSVTEMTGTGPVVGQHFDTIVGTLSGDPMPVNCAVLLRKNTSLGGRKGRGRMYLPPCFFGESGVDPAGVIAGVLLGPLSARFNAANGQLIGVGIFLSLLHEDGSAATPINGFSAQSVIATQRRRLR